MHLATYSWMVGSAAVAALLSLLLVLVLSPLAEFLGLLDHPGKERKDHAQPVPVVGGLAILLASTSTSWLLQAYGSPATAGLLVGLALLAIAGLLDDIYDIRWHWRLAAQVTAALAMVYVGDVRIEQVGQLFGMQDSGLGWLSVPLTVVATVGLINAINMVDGVDGLAGALTCACLLMLAAAALYAGNAVTAQRTMIIAGAVAGFLAMNLRMPWRPRARVFLGNMGSELLGFVIAWLSFRLTQNPAHPVSPVLALWLLPIPVIDTLSLIATRIAKGHSPFFADRNHVHHLMLDAGFGVTSVVAILTGTSLLCGLLVAQAMRWDVPNLLLLLLFAAALAWWMWLSWRRERAIAFFRALRVPGRGAPPAVRGSDEGRA